MSLEHCPGPPTGPARADGPPVPEGCDACRRALGSLRVPGVFRLAHLLLLDAVGTSESTVRGPADVDRAELAFVVGLDRVGVGDHGPPQWRDAGWLLRDLEDWGLVDLMWRGSTSEVEGVRLTERARVLLARLCPSGR
jgi:hypothetical protein